MDCNFQYVDLSFVNENRKTAILCRTIEDAETLFHNAKEQFPQHLCWSLEDTLDVWRYNGEKTGFTFFCDYDDESGDLSYCDEQWFRAGGYELIEFSDLVQIPELEEGDMPIEFLMGGAMCS